MEIGGAERELVTFLEAAVGAGYSFQVISLAKEGAFREEVERLTGKPVLSPTSELWLLRLLWFRRIILKLRPSIVHSWNMFPMYYLALAFKRRPCPFIGFLQNMPSQWDGKSWLRWTVPFLVRSPDALISNSRAALRELEKREIKTGPSIVVHNGVQQKFFEGHPTAAIQTIRNSECVVVGLGRLIERKRVNWIIHAVARLRKEGLAVDLWLIGDGPERQILEALSERESIRNRVTFWGERYDVQDILSAADIMAHCASAEGLPNAVQEGMAAGLPVVAARTSGIPEIIEHGKEGLLFDVDDFEEFVASLRRLVIDKAERAVMAHAARFRAETNFLPRIMAEKITGFYEKILDGALDKKSDRPKSATHPQGSHH
ncbi:MAG TPA: glycosyltransferase family 4 protein [Syntrophorhabdus sp.]|nr:glycosyltransferase family 4 protein [Syntrophorhabdus sp.]